MRELISTILTIELIGFLIRACRSEKDLVQYSIDVVSEYYEYADSVFNSK